jgi:hypothetical protein
MLIVLASHKFRQGGGRSDEESRFCAVLDGFSGVDLPDCNEVPSG